MNRREKKPTGRREEEGLKNPKRRIKDMLPMIKNHILKCIGAIKAKMKSNKSLTIFISVVILFAIAIIIIAANNCCWMETSNAIITLVGIVLAFIGILLSYKGLLISHKGLMLTKEVKEDIALQQFKLRQQEVMSSLAYTLNTKLYYIKFVNVSDKSVNVLKKRMNYKGMETAMWDEESDFAKYKDANLSYTGTSPLHSFSYYWGNSYLPPDVSIKIKNFTKFVDGASNNKSNGSYVTILNTGREPYGDDIMEKDISLNCTWGEFVKEISSLISMIEKWYRNEYNQKDYKMPSCIMEVKYDKKELE